MRALIFAGQIVDVAAADFPVSPGFAWVDMPAGATMKTHVFSGGAVVPKQQAEIDAEETAAAAAELAAIDLASIRGIREWVAAQPGAPVVILEREAAAITARARMK